MPSLSERSPTDVDEVAYAHKEHPTGNQALFDRWTEGRQLPFLGTNKGAPPLAFQRWHKFKEAFPPELIQRAVRQHSSVVRSCLDPFGGSGTTALTAQFLGIPSTTVEINPFLADVIRAKVALYDSDRLARDLGFIVGTANTMGAAGTYFKELPATFIEPGVGDRWLFGASVAAQLDALLAAIDRVAEPLHRNLFRILVGGLLVDVSNASISGKGRRYRRNWQDTPRSAALVMSIFRERARAAITDVHRFRRSRAQATIIVGDSRKIEPAKQFDLAVFSPPYPNSFDYTDVYNIELWMLGYLSKSADNQTLRAATLSSHVQIRRDFARPPGGSAALAKTLDSLCAARSKLWSPWIPEMVGAYFADLLTVLEHVHGALVASGRAWIVVGDSSYAGNVIPTAQILQQLTKHAGWSSSTIEPLRELPSSAQQRKVATLHEWLVVLTKES